MWTRRMFALAAPAVGAVMSARAASVAAATARGTRALEAEALRRFAEATHPRGREAAGDPAWRVGWRRLEGAADGLGDGAYIVGLRRLLGWFGEGHTTVAPFEFTGGPPEPLKRGPWSVSFPIKAVAFHDGLWVVEAKDEASPLLGARIERVGSLTVAEVMARHAAAWPCENPAWAHNWAQSLFHYAGALEGLGVIASGLRDPLRIEAVRGDGRPVSTALRARSDGDQDRTRLERPPSPRETWAAQAGVGNYVRVRSDRRAVYLSIDDMADLPKQPFARLTAELLEAMRDPGVDRLVVDLRRNGGGDNYLGEALRHEIARSRFNRMGGLFVLTGPATFSAGQNLANRLERETLAAFVGEPTGSAPNLRGDAKLFTGPSTGFTALIATKLWDDGGPDDRRRWIFPDIPSPVLFGDWAAGRDLALEAALSAAPSGADDFASRSRYFERAGQDAAWRPFWLRA